MSEPGPPQAQPPSHADQVAEFVQVANTSTSQAEFLLRESNWDLAAALHLFYTGQEQAMAEPGDCDHDQGHGESESESEATAAPSRSTPAGLGQAHAHAHTASPAPPLRNASASPASAASASGYRASPRRGIATLRDLQGGSGGGSGAAGMGRGGGRAGRHADSDSDYDDEDDDDEPQDLFAGGEKSGLAVQNPDDLKRKIIEKAKR
ncbi:hypothetical protein KEM52_002500 [Ascosphaera acerosa]|nr:hypothetical protein KEM52_002500 [Ascosphaera acerosa]